MAERELAIAALDAGAGPLEQVGAFGGDGGELFALGLIDIGGEEGCEASAAALVGRGAEGVLIVGELRAVRGPFLVGRGQEVGLHDGGLLGRQREVRHA